MADEEKKELVKKFKVAPFLNIGTGAAPVWLRIRKATSFDLSLNPETQDFEYIADEMPTTELLRYKPSLSLPITMYKGEPDYALAFDKFYNLKTGEDAKADLLIVFFAEKTVERAEKTVTRDVYAATADTAVDASKTYYARDAESGAYTAVETPADADIAGYFEKSTATETVTESTNTYKAWKTSSLLSVQSFNSVDSTITVQTDFCGTLKRGIAKKVDGVITFIEDETDEANSDDALTW